MAGVTHRVGEVFEILDRIPGSHDRNQQQPETDPDPESSSRDSGSSGPLVGTTADERQTAVQGSIPVLKLMN